MDLAQIRPGDGAAVGDIDLIEEREILIELAVGVDGLQDGICHQLLIPQEQLMPRPLVVHRRAGGVDPVLGIASQGLVASIGNIILGGGGDIDDVLHAALLHLGQRQHIVHPLDADGGSHPQAGAGIGDLRVFQATFGAIGLESLEEALQLLIVAEGDVHRCGHALSIGADDRRRQIRCLQGAAIGIPHMGAVHARRHSQTVLGIQLHADDVIGEGQVVELRVAGVGQLELIADGRGPIHRAAVLHLLTELGGVLLHAQAGVGDVHIGHDPAVGTIAVTLHVIEVEGADLTLSQRQRIHPILLRLVQSLIRSGIRLDASCPLHVIVDVHLDCGDGVGTADIQHQLTIDEQVNVIVTFELEEQVIVLIVDELTIGGHDVVVVAVYISIFIRSHHLGAIIPEVGGTDLTRVFVLRIHHGHEGEPGSGSIALVAPQILGAQLVVHQGDGTVADHIAIGIFLTIVVVIHGALGGVLVRIQIGDLGAFRIVLHLGSIARVEDIGSLVDAVLILLVQGSVAQSQVAEIVLDLVVGAADEDIVQQEVGCVHAGIDVLSAVLEGAHQLFPGGGIIVTEEGLGALGLLEGELDPQLMPKSGGQIHGGLAGLLHLIAVGVDHVVGIAITVEVCGELVAGGTGDEVVVIVAGGIELGDPQCVVQQLRHILHRLLPIHRATVLDGAFQ